MVLFPKRQPHHIRAWFSPTNLAPTEMWKNNITLPWTRKGRLFIETRLSDQDPGCSVIRQPCVRGEHPKSLCLLLKEEGLI